MTNPDRLLLAVAATGGDEARALGQELRLLLPDHPVVVLPAPVDASGPTPEATLELAGAHLLVLLGWPTAGAAAGWLDAASAAGVPVVLLPETGAARPGESAARVGERAARVAYHLRGVLSLPAAAGRVPDPPPTPLSAVLLQRESSNEPAAAPLSRDPGAASRDSVAGDDIGLLRELRSRLHAARSELRRVEASPWWRLGRGLEKISRVLGRLGHRLAHPVETLQMLTAEHLPPAVRKGGVTLVHGLLGRRGTEAAWSPGALPTSGSGLGARPVVICLAERPWDAARARPQQLMTHLARRGWPVLYVCKSPSASLAPAPAGAHEATEVAPRVFLLQLTGGPGRADLPGWPEEDEAAAWCACVEELRLSTDVREAVVVMQRLDWWPVAERLRESSGWPVVYDRTERRWDVDQDSSHLRALEARVMAEVDGIWASSATLLGSTPASSHLVSLVGNACDRELWATPAPEPPGLPPRPRIVCQAQLDGLLDVELLRELAHARPQWSLVLPGAARAAAGAALAALPNVHFLTPPSAADLPALLGAMDLGVLPFASNRLTEGMDPVELHELAASGLPVVATPLPEITSRGDLVETAEGPRALLEAAERALARLPDSEATRRRRRSLAASWHDRAAAAASNLEQVFPLVSIVIVTYNNLQLTRLCLDSILAVTEYPNLELVIVDNASSDGTGAWLAEYARAHESTRVVLNDDNRGFAAGTNQGVREARGEILCLLNNDTVVTAGWLSALVQALRSDHKLGMVGPVTNAAGNEAKVRARYATLAELPAWAAAYTRSHEGASMELPMLALFCAALRREVWERVGELDEQFEIGMFEDDDYCRRIRAAGFELRCLKYAFVHHWQRAAFRLLGDDLYWRTYTANRARFRKKWCHGQRPTAGGRGSAGPSRIQG